MDADYVFLISFVIITIGYLVKKLKIITEENGDVIAKIIFNITLPAVILRITSSIKFDISLILLPFITILFSLFVLVIAFLIFKKTSKESKGIILMTVIGFNVANFAFPLISGIYGDEGLQYIALIDLGNAITVFIICYLIAIIYSPKMNQEDDKIEIKKVGKTLLKSVPLWSYLIALILNFSGVEMPIFMDNVLIVFSNANSVLALLLLGIYLNFKFEKAEWKLVFKILAIRYTLGLIIGLTLFYLLPVNDLFKIIVLISLVLPIGLAIIPFSVELEYDQKLINMLVSLTIIISFVLIWVLIILLG